MQNTASWISECRSKTWPELRCSDPKIKIADLFSGCGGLSLGALIASVRSGRRLEISLAADVWPEALEVYKENFAYCLKDTESRDLSEMVKELGSIHLSAQGEELVTKLGSLDIVVAGPPCQGHSDLNNSSRRNDPRNLLYTIPVAVALETNAKILVVENVPTVVHSSGQVVNSALRSMKERGYCVAEMVAEVQDFGLPQTRKRHLLIASRVHDEEELVAVLDGIPKRTRELTLWDSIHDLEDEEESSGSLLARHSKISEDNIKRIEYLFTNDLYDLPNEYRPACHRDKTHSYVSMYGRLHANKPAQTITSGFGSMGQGRFVHPTRRRMLTAHEAARIQGFPDYFNFAKVKKITALREMIANAVPPALMAGLLAALISKI